MISYLTTTIEPLETQNIQINIQIRQLGPILGIFNDLLPHYKY